MPSQRRFVKHPEEDLWAVIAPGRMKRPDETGVVRGKRAKKERENPFAPGNEGATPPEVFRIGEGGPLEPGWKVRVVPNKFPIFDQHEVVVLHPEGLDFGEFSREHALLVFRAYRERYNSLKGKGRVFIFHNVGRDAGASLKHPHSQIAVLPNDLPISFETPPSVENVIKETEGFVTFCPEFSQWPYETWILKRGVKKEFGSFGNQELEELSALLNELMKKVKEVLGKDVPYNFYMRPDKSTSGGWYLRLFPRLTIWGPVELGAGIAVDPVDPAEAANLLKLP